MRRKDEPECGQSFALFDLWRMSHKVQLVAGKRHRVAIAERWCRRSGPRAGPYKFDLVGVVCAVCGVRCAMCGVRCAVRCAVCESALGSLSRTRIEPEAHEGYPVLGGSN